MAFVPLWFILIAVLWTGFFVLEGFDMGVGMLHAVIGKDEPGKQTVLATIGPLWDGNEVWLVVAAAAMFAAFPGWYATMFSGFYLAVVLMLLALILRGTSFEYRGKNPSRRWHGNWSRLLTVASLLAPFLIGLMLGDLLHGVPIGANHEYTGNFGNVFQPYAIFVGITLVALCVLHGATFVALKTDGAVQVRAGKLARRVAPLTALIVLAFVGWTHVTAGGGGFLNPVELLIALAVLAAWSSVRDHQGWAFTATTVDDRGIHHHDLRRPLSQGHGVQHQSCVQPDGAQQRLPAVLPEGDDRHRPGVPADRAGLPGLVLLRVPPPDQRPGVPAQHHAPALGVRDGRDGGPASRGGHRHRDGAAAAAFAGSADRCEPTERCGHSTRGWCGTLAPPVAT